MTDPYTSTVRAAARSALEDADRDLFPDQVLAHLRAAITTSSTPGLDTASAVLSKPTNEEKHP